MKIQKWWNPAFVSILVIVSFIGFVVNKADGDILELAQIGTQFSEAVPNGSEGYDGQFVYYLALDSNPESVAELLDVPAYRYQRILLPLLARFLSFGEELLIPWAILIISLLIHYLAIQKLSKILIAYGQSPWFALAYALWVGLMLSIRLNLPEALAIGMILIALSYFKKSQHLLTWIWLSLAVFAKETMLIFILAFALFYFASKNWRYLAGLITIAILPFAIFQFYLLAQFGSFGINSGGIRATAIELIPFNGIWKIANFSWPVFLIFLTIYLPLVIVPSLIGIWTSFKKLFQGNKDIEVFLLLAISPIFLFLPFSLYSEPIGLFRMLTLLLLSWMLFAAKFRIKRVLIYAMISMFLNVLLISELFLA